MKISSSCSYAKQRVNERLEGEKNMSYFLGRDLDADVLERVSQTFKALSDPTRIRILLLLANEECPVNQVADALQLSQSAVSHQLKTLRAYRFVRHHREGQNVLYICDDAYIIGLLNEAILYASK